MNKINPDPLFWQNKRVFLTGHTGFKGAWLSLWLQSLGAQVTGYALSPPTKKNLFEIAQVAENMSAIHADIRDLTQLKSSLLDSQAEIVIHMAAQALVRSSYHDPIETYSTNIMGTVNLLEAVKHSDYVKVVIVVTSDKCYENQEWLWGYRENEAMGGKDPYSSSKACAELVTAAYRASYFQDNHTAIATVRAGNVIGGGDWGKDRLIPDIMQAFMKNQSVKIRYPNAIRPWQHVLEPLKGYLRLAEALWNQDSNFSEGWNFASDEHDAKPVAWIADRLVSLWGQEAHWTNDNSSQPHEANYLKLDCSKAKHRLEWSPCLSLETALQWTLKWYQHYQEGNNMQEVTIQQILSYQEIK